MDYETLVNLHRGGNQRGAFPNPDSLAGRIRALRPGEVLTATGFGKNPSSAASNAMYHMRLKGQDTSCYFIRNVDGVCYVARRKES